MTSKDCKRVEMRTLRSSQRGKPLEEKEDNPPHVDKSINNCDSNEHHNQIEEHKEEQISPKNEKESTDPPQNDQQPITISDDRVRRITRSTALLSKKMCSQMDLQNEQLTPEDNPISKIEEQPTSKKMLKLPSAVSLSEHGSHDLTATVKKPILKIAESISSPYSEVRKSYRKIHKKEIISIPYRKCHDAFEGRIVTIINKIQSGKNCLRDFQSLIDKMQKITGKDMTNRYIIGGIKTIIKLGKEKDIYDVKLIERLEKEQHKLKHKILEQLQKMEDFQHQLLEKNQQESIDIREYRHNLVRKIYKLMKLKRGKVNLKETRERALLDCERYFNCEPTIGSLIRFIKQQNPSLQQ